MDSADPIQNTPAEAAADVKVMADGQLAASAAAKTDSAQGQSEESKQGSLSIDAVVSSALSESKVAS